jgi:hypothetical protein
MDTIPDCQRRGEYSVCLSHSAENVLMEVFLDWWRFATLLGKMADGMAAFQVQEFQFANGA